MSALPPPIERLCAEIEAERNERRTYAHSRVALLVARLRQLERRAAYADAERTQLAAALAQITMVPHGDAATLRQIAARALGQERAA